MLHFFFEFRYELNFSSRSLKEFHFYYLFHVPPFIIYLFHNLPPKKKKKNHIAPKLSVICNQPPMKS